MKNFLKENWFKVSILFIAIMTLSLAAYFYNKSVIAQDNREKIAAQEKIDEQQKKQVADQQAAQAKIDEDKKNADQQAAQQKADQDKKDLADKQAAAVKKKIDSCLSVMNQAFTSRVEREGYSEAAQKIYEDGKALCLRNGN